MTAYAIGGGRAGRPRWLTSVSTHVLGNLGTNTYFVGVIFASPASGLFRLILSTSKTLGGARHFPAAAATLACLAICGVLIAAYVRGADQDEYSTIYFADPAVPFGAAWKDVWPTETNPPFFYVIARFFVPVTGRALLACRLVNVIPLLFLLTWFYYTAIQKPSHRQFLTCLAIFVFSGWFFIQVFPYYRSYFWQYSTATVFIGAFSIGFLDHDARPDIFQLVALPFLLVMHQITALYAGVLLITTILIELHRRNFLRAGCLMAVGLAASILIGYFTWLQLNNFSSVMVAVSWIQPLGPLSAAWTILQNLLPATGNNWVALLTVGLIAVVPRYRPVGPRSSLIWLIAGAGIAATALVLLVNQHFPLVYDYYFSFLAVEAIVIISLVITPVLSAKPWLLALVVVNAGVYMTYNLIAVLDDRELLADADMVKQLVAQCAETQIHAGSRPPAMGLDPVKVIAPPQSEQTALQGLAASDHLTLLPLAPDTPDKCPVIYWTEYRAPSKIQIDQHNGNVESAVNDYAGFALDAATLARAKAIRLWDSFAMVLVVKR